MTVPRVLYVGRDARLPGLLSSGPSDAIVVAATETDAATAELLAGPIDCLVYDRLTPHEGAADFLRFVQEVVPDVPVVLRTADPSADRGVSSGLYDESVSRVDSDESGRKEPDGFDGVDDGRALLAAVERHLRPDRSTDGRRATAREGALRALERERAFVDDVLDNLTDVFFVMNADAEFVRWNERVSEVTGYESEEIARMSPFDLMADEDAERAAAAVSEVLSTGEATEEIRIETRDGTLVPYEFVGSLVRGASGEPRYVCGIGRDISGRKRRERQLRRKREELDRKNAELDRKNAELERSNAELERFASAASHDLQEPLRMVSSYLGLLDRRYGDDLDADAREFVAAAVDGADRMREMIDDLLRYSRVSRREEPRAPVDCDAVVRTVLDNVQVAVRRTDAEIVVDSLPTVVGMETLLVLLFQNLVGNALAYAGDEPPRIRIRAEPREEGCDGERGEAYLFAVADDGVGIPREKRDRIFDLFSGEGGGTGIGLATCKRIVERHGGEIWVESEPDEGSTFFFTLPAASDATAVRARSDDD